MNIYVHMCMCVHSNMNHDVTILVQVLHVEHADVFQLLDGCHPIINQYQYEIYYTQK